MPLKKSAHLLILLGLSSVSLVIYSANVVPIVPVKAVMTVQCCIFYLGMFIYPISTFIS